LRTTIARTQAKPRGRRTGGRAAAGLRGALRGRGGVSVPASILATSDAKRRPVRRIPFRIRHMSATCLSAKSTWMVRHRPSIRQAKRSVEVISSMRLIGISSLATSAGARKFGAKKA
jgi:hypothetical protein